MSRFRPSDFVQSRRGFQAQSGNGLGNFLGTAYKTIAPHIKTVGEKVISSPVVQDVLATAKKSAKDAGLQIAADTLKGGNKNLGAKLGRAKREIAKTIEDSVSASKSQKRKAPTKRRGGKKLKVHYTDIFDEDFF